MVRRLFLFSFYFNNCFRLGFRSYFNSLFELRRKKSRGWSVLQATHFWRQFVAAREQSWRWLHPKNYSFVSMVSHLLYDLCSRLIAYNIFDNILFKTLKLFIWVKSIDGWKMFFEINENNCLITIYFIHVDCWKSGQIHMPWQKLLLKVKSQHTAKGYPSEW